MLYNNDIPEQVYHIPKRILQIYDQRGIVDIDREEVFMLETRLSGLKERKYGRHKKIWEDISNMVREVSPEVSQYKVFCITYLAYLAADNQLKDAKSLMRFTDERMDENRRRFIEDNIDDLWRLVVKIGNAYQRENLASLVLWGPVCEDSKWGLIETPESIVKLTAGLLEGTDETVADFCCGCGAFLLEAACRENGSSYFGMETNAGCREVAAIRLELASCGNAEINQGSVFSLDSGRKFDRIFCDYPWGCKIKGMQNDTEQIGLLTEKIPELLKAGTADWLFIANAVCHLNDGGRAVVITTNGTMVNGGVNVQIRKKFIDFGWLEAVISLPANLYSMKPAAISLLVLSHNNKEVRMIDASQMIPSGKRQSMFSDDAVEDVVSLMEKDAANSIKVSVKELEHEDYVFSPSRYLDGGKELKNGAAFEDVIKNIKRGVQIKASELYEHESDIPTDIQYLMLANIQDGIIYGELSYLKELESKLEKYCIRDNNLLISKSGTPTKIAVASVREGQRMLANGNLYVIELDDGKVNPYFLKAYLESAAGAKALSKMMVGTTMPNIPVDSLRRMQIPLPPMEEQNVIADKCKKNLEDIRKLKDDLAGKIRELKSLYDDYT